jgi:hypothetical protein
MSTWINLIYICIIESLGYFIFHNNIFVDFGKSCPKQAPSKGSYIPKQAIIKDDRILTWNMAHKKVSIIFVCHIFCKLVSSRKKSRDGNQCNIGASY